MSKTTGTVGHGTTVHFLSGSVSHRPLCGSGNNTIGTRKTYNGRITGQPVTCKKCLAEAEKRNQFSEFVAMVDASEKPMLTPYLQATASRLNDGYPLPAWFHSVNEWWTIHQVYPLQIEADSDGVLQVRAAVLSTPGFEPLACEANATQAADWMIDERMDSLGKYRGE